MIAIEKLSHHTGAEIKNIDLRTPQDSDQIDRIYKALLDRTIVLIRDQDLTQQDLVRVTGYFGKLGNYGRTQDLTGSAQARAAPNVMLVTNLRENGKPAGALPDGEMWFHHDTIHREIPHKITLLYGVEIPTHGGNTLFSNLYAAYETLPAHLRAALDGRKAVHKYNTGAMYKGDVSVSAVSWQAIHPAVITHDETGRKAVYVDRLMTHALVDLPNAESDDILSQVFDHIEQDSLVYEHVWKKGDLVMWDNRSSVHARRDFPADQLRMLWRTTIAGEKAPQ